MAKGVAIPYIIALILGIVVVGILAYWYFGLAGKGGGTVATIECDAQKLSYCQEWQSLGFIGSPIFAKYDENSCGSLGKDEPEKKANCKTILQISLSCSGANTASCTDVSSCCDGKDKPKSCSTLATQGECLACGCLWG